VAAQLTLDDKGTCQKVGIGLTNVGPTPVKARKAEEFLRGKKLDEANIKQAAQLAADESAPSPDLRGPVEYKKGMVKELAKRALTRALERAAK
jgi:carbon-monoxide dehydrogenase medium subunit